MNFSTSKMPITDRAAFLILVVVGCALATFACGWAPGHYRII